MLFFEKKVSISTFWRTPSHLMSGIVGNLLIDYETRSNWKWLLLHCYQNNIIATPTHAPIVYFSTEYLNPLWWPMRCDIATCEDTVPWPVFNCTWPGWTWVYSARKLPPSVWFEQYITKHTVNIVLWYDALMAPMLRFIISVPCATDMQIMGVLHFNFQFGWGRDVSPGLKKWTQTYTSPIWKITAHIYTKCYFSLPIIIPTLANMENTAKTLDSYDQIRKKK